MRRTKKITSVTEAQTRHSETIGVIRGPETIQNSRDPKTFLILSPSTRHVGGTPLNHPPSSQSPALITFERPTELALHQGWRYT